MNVIVCNVSKGRDERGVFYEVGVLCLCSCSFLLEQLSAFFCFLFYNLARESTTHRSLLRR